MISRCLCVIILIELVSGTSARASDTWTIDDVVNPESAGSWTLSRDGATAVWSRSQVERVEGQERRVGNLWLTRLGEGEPQSFQLTRGRDGAGSPRISPNGELIAFTTGRDVPDAQGDAKDARQIWVIPVDGGEAYAVTRLARSPRSFDWIDDETFLIVAQESATLWEKEQEEKKDTARVVEDALREPPTRLFCVSINSGRAERLTSNTDWIRSAAVSPDGSWAVISAAQSLSYGFDQRVPPHTRLVNLQTGEATRLFAETDLLPGRIIWSPDSSGFFFTNQYSTHPQYRQATITHLHHFDIAAEDHQQVALDWPRGIGGSIQATEDGVIVMLANGVRSQPARIWRDDDGWHRTLLEGRHERSLNAMTLAHDGRSMLYTRSSTTEWPQTFAARLEGSRIVDEKQITELNKQFETKPQGRVEIITWTGANGDEVEGILRYPFDHEEGQTYPLILNPHGGPAGTSMDRWSLSWGSPRLLWQQEGAFVLEPNYHGSAGYGLEWVESIGGGKYYELETPDLVNGVDHLIAEGLVDPDRLAVAGWSNGGILAAELITRSTRWKAASVGAADVEWISDWANVDFGAAFDNYYFGASPLEDPQTYIDKSPFFRLDQVTTPTIVFTGTEDRNVPPHQSWSLFRMMQQLELAPVRLVLFPGEPHGLRKIAHQRRKIEEDLAWFRRYLFESEEAGNEAIKEGSRLNRLIALHQVGQIDGAYGVEVNGVLAPETVERDAVQISRFEITRAQFAAFDSDYPIDERPNDPATNVTFEQAGAYVAWLAEQTGLPCRLPTVAEAEQWGGSGGNTLDHWAGYAPNPEDIARLHAALADLPEGALLQRVGSHQGAGDPLVFDLAGNAAEWAVGEEGEGVLIGGSADQPANKDDRNRDATPAYRGFRIVIGPLPDTAEDDAADSG